MSLQWLGYPIYFMDMTGFYGRKSVLYFITLIIITDINAQKLHAQLESNYNASTHDVNEGRVLGDIHS